MHLSRGATTSLGVPERLLVQLTFAFELPVLLKPFRPPVQGAEGVLREHLGARRRHRVTQLGYEQLVIELRVSAAPKRDGIVVSPLMEEIERILRRLAASRSPMPNNPILGELAGGRRRNSAARALEKLVLAGRITVETMPGQRRVVFADGRMTGWGESRPGHKPFCRNARGQQPPPPPPKREAPVLVDVFVPREHRPDVPAARQCQWPLWADGEKPNGLYCGQKTLSWKVSWCPEHAGGGKKVRACQGSAEKHASGAFLG